MWNILIEKGLNIELLKNAICVLGAEALSMIEIRKDLSIYLETEDSIHNFIDVPLL